MGDWIYVIEWAVMGFIFGLLIKRFVLKTKTLGFLPEIVLTLAFALVAVRFIIIPEPSLNGEEITGSIRLLQTIIYSSATAIVFILAFRIKGFDYEAAAAKRAREAGYVDSPERKMPEEWKEDAKQGENGTVLDTIVGTLDDTGNRTIEFVYLSLLLLLGVFAAWAFNDVDMVWWKRAIGFVAASVPFLVMGHKIESWKDGEVLLMAAAGVLIGWINILVAVFFAVVLSGLVSTFKLLTRSREEKGRKLKPMRMAPFLATGIYFAALFGETFLWWFYGLYLR